MHSVKATVSVGVALIASSCASVSGEPPPVTSEWIGYELVHPRIRDELDMKPGYQMLLCGTLVAYGNSLFRLEGEEPLEQIIVSDSPGLFFDNRTGRRVAQCGHWYCTKHVDYCRRTCPPSKWTCDASELL